MADLGFPTIRPSASLKTVNCYEFEKGDEENAQLGREYESKVVLRGESTLTHCVRAVVFVGI